jgi:hypothetical protein
MGTLEGFPNPPAMVRRRHSRRAPHATTFMGTLEGFPNPPAMVRRRHSRRAPHAITWEPSKGSQTLPRWFAAGTAGGLPTRVTEIDSL